LRNKYKIQNEDIITTFKDFILYNNNCKRDISSCYTPINMPPALVQVLTVLEKLDIQDYNNKKDLYEKLIDLAENENTKNNFSTGEQNIISKLIKEIKNKPNRPTQTIGGFNLFKKNNIFLIFILFLITFIGIKIKPFFS
jgi:hypothetical protein